MTHDESAITDQMAHHLYEDELQAFGLDYDGHFEQGEDDDQQYQWDEEELWQQQELDDDEGGLDDLQHQEDERQDAHDFWTHDWDLDEDGQPEDDLNDQDHDLDADLEEALRRLSTTDLQPRMAHYSRICRSNYYPNAAQIIGQGLSFLEMWKSLGPSEDRLNQNPYFPFDSFDSWQFASIFFRTPCPLTWKSELLATNVVSKRIMMFR